MGSVRRRIRFMRGQRLDLVATVPPLDCAHGFPAHVAVPVIYERPRTPFATAVGDASAESKAHDPMSVGVHHHAEISVRILGGFESVL